MLKLEHAEVVGWESAIRGMRNPMNSWENSTSDWCPNGTGYAVCSGDPRDFCPRMNTDDPAFCICSNDLDLMTRLRNAGTDHRKFMRMIIVYIDITAPLYWWKEFDTYKVGTVANSCSTMHKIHVKDFTRADFSHEHLIENRDLCWSNKIMAGTEDSDSPTDILDIIIEALNIYRNAYIGTKDKQYWWQMIQLLPSSYNQKRTVMLNYEVLANIYKSRKDHKLDEWRKFCDWIEGLPYSEIIIGENRIGKEE